MEHDEGERRNVVLEFSSISLPPIFQVEVELVVTSRSRHLGGISLHK